MKSEALLGGWVELRKLVKLYAFSSSKLNGLNGRPQMIGHQTIGSNREREEENNGGCTKIEGNIVCNNHWHTR